MFEIIHKETFAAETYLMDVYAPRIAHSALPGQFLIIKMEENSERIPLTISDYHRVRGTVTIVFKAIGESTKKMAEFKEGDRFADIVGPLGKPSEFATMTAEELRKRSFVFIGGGVGIAPRTCSSSKRNWLRSVTSMSLPTTAPQAARAW